MKIFNSVLDLIGNTPLLKLNNYLENSENNIYAKLEYFNPAGSVKDRVGKAMIEEAEKNNLINKDTTIIEPTSGNTGIGLAAVCTAKGYKLILTMPESMSVERRELLKAYGAEIVLTPASEGMRGAINRAEELKSEIKNSYIPFQFENPANPNVHYMTTGREIWEDLEGNLDIFIAGIGTGGTISGIGKYLKEKNPNIRIVGIEPLNSAVINGESGGSHKIQGIGAGFIPKNLDLSIVDEVAKVTDEEAYDEVKQLAKAEGVLVGISSGAALSVAKKLSAENKGKNIVVLLADTGERYMSTGVFQ